VESIADMPDVPDVPDAVLGRRDVVVASGADALTYLHSQLSQDLRSLAVGDRCWSLVLEPNGKVVALTRVTRTGDDRFELDVDAGYGELLMARLQRFKIRVAVDLELVQGIGTGGVDESARIAFGWPAMGREIEPGAAIAAGLGLNRIAVSFTKGCYPGQELLERMDSRAAEAPRTLRRLRVPAGSVAGDAVFDGDDEVGWLTSVAGTAALAWIKRTSDLGEPIQH
jgi:folate-binding protein YgfZ